MVNVLTRSEILGNIPSKAAFIRWVEDDEIPARAEQTVTGVLDHGDP